MSEEEIKSQDGRKVPASPLGKSKGKPLPAADRKLMEKAFGADLSNLRAHTGPAAKVACEALGAKAFAHGNDVAFAQNPDLFTVAHEAAHTVVQKQRPDIIPTKQGRMKAQPIVDCMMKCFKTVAGKV